MNRFIFFIWLAAASTLIVENIVIPMQWFTFIWITTSWVLSWVSIIIWFLMWFWFYWWFIAGRDKEDDYNEDSFYN